MTRGLLSILLMGLTLFVVAAGTGQVSTPSSLQDLQRSLNDTSAAVRESAIDALVKLGPGATPAIPQLVRLLSDRDPYVNGKAAEALGRIGLPSVPSLIAALRDTSVLTRWCAAIALGKIRGGATEAIPALIQAVQDPSANVRWTAAVALGEMRTRARTAVPALTNALHDPDEHVRVGASMALDAVDPSRLTRPTEWKSVFATIDSLVPVLMHDLHVPGVSIAVIRDRTIAWSHEYGVADARTGAPVDPQTLFEACSMTKPVFAYTVLKLAELGKLTLDRPITEILPDHTVPTQPSRARITPRMVLSHTSGLPNWRMGDEERDGPLPVLFEPGSRFLYSGEGYLWLQHAVEHILGEPIAPYAQRTLFQPLGLQHSSYVWSPDVEAHLAAGHDANGIFRMKTRYTHANAAYTLYTTPREYATFLIEIMRPDRSASHSLTAASLKAMLAHQVTLDSRVPIERPGRARGSAVYWGLGWSINATPSGDIVHHGGSNGSGFRCFSQCAPTRGTGIVIMTNSTSGDDLWTRLIAAIGDL